MTSAFKLIYHLVSKDILAELRSKEMLVSLFFFSLMVIIIFHFTIEVSGVSLAEIAAGLIWVAFTFSGIIGLNRSFSSELHNGCLQGLMLTPMDRGDIYIAKMLANTIFMMTVELMLVPIFTFLLNVPVLEHLGSLALVFLLGTWGYTAVGTLLAAISANTSAQEVMLPILLLPLIIPILMGAVSATGLIINSGKGIFDADVLKWLKLLVGFDIIFTTVCYLTFEYVIEE